MATQTSTKERLATLEEQGKRNLEDHKTILEEVKCMNNKLDAFAANKADKSEVEDMKSKLWWIITTVAGSFVAVLLYIIQDAIKK